jgi:hypothetical protein
LHRRERYSHLLLPEPEQSPDANDNSLRSAVPVHQQIVNLSDLLIVRAVNSDLHQLEGAPLRHFLSDHEADA